MVVFLRNRIGQSFAFCLVFMLIFSLKAYGGFRKDNIQPEHLQKILNLAGVESEVLSLNREDVFERGLFFETPNGIAIIIGFPKRGIRTGRPFLLATLNDEVIVELSEDGTISIISGDEDFRSTGILDIIACQLDATQKMIDAINQCNLDLSSFDLICVLEAVLQGSIDITECFLANLTE